MHRRAGSHSADTRSRPASGRRPNTVGKPLRWRTSTGIRAKFSETTGEAPTYTTSCGRLKQPDKQKLLSCSPPTALPDLIPTHFRFPQIGNHPTADFTGLGL